MNKRRRLEAEGWITPSLNDTNNNNNYETTIASYDDYLDENNKDYNNNNNNNDQSSNNNNHPSSTTNHRQTSTTRNHQTINPNNNHSNNNQNRHKNSPNNNPSSNSNNHPTSTTSKETRRPQPVSTVSTSTTTTQATVWESNSQPVAKHKSLVNAEKICGLRSAPRIVGGKETKANSWIWIAALIKNGMQLEFKFFLYALNKLIYYHLNLDGTNYCGGTLITSSHVVTAA